MADYNLNKGENYDLNGAILGSNMRQQSAGIRNLLTIEDQKPGTTGTIESMNGVLSGLSYVKNIDISNLNTANLINTSNMCKGSTALQTISNFDTHKVTDMSRMFYQCWNLTTVPDFDTHNVTNMASMFFQCKYSHAPNLDTSNVTDMSYMFAGCTYLNYIPALDLSSATKVTGMFSETSYMR